MVETFQALAVLVVGLLPGALYVWTFERQAGRWGIGLSDRLLRFVGGSVLFHAVFAPVSYWFWREQWPLVRSGEPVPWTLWLLVLAYVGLPSLLGTMVGRGTRKGSRWAQWFTGPDPAPRAWDFLFQHQVDGWVRLRLKSGVWLAGAFANANGRRSYASGYPEAQELYLAASVAVDPGTGEFRFNDAGHVEVEVGGLLVRWDEVEYLEFVDA